MAGLIQRILYATKAAAARRAVASARGVLEATGSRAARRAFPRPAVVVAAFALALGACGSAAVGSGAGAGAGSAQPAAVGGSDAPATVGTEAREPNAGAVAAAEAVALANLPATRRLYVTNQASASVSVIDLATLEVAYTLDLREYGFTANAKPHDVVAEPDGEFWYVSLIGDNAIVKFSADGRVAGRGEFLVPGMLALLPGGERVYSTHTMSVANPPRRIAEVRTGSMAVEEIGTFFPRPHGLDAHPSGDYVYVASLAVNRLGVLDVSTGEYELIELEGPSPVLAHTAMAPDGSTLVVSTQAAEVRVFDLGDPAAPRLVGAIPVGSMPWRPAFTPDGRTLYVPNKADNTISVVDMELREVVEVIRHPAIAQPYAAIVSPDGERVFIANSNTEGDWVPGGAEAGAAGVAAGDRAAAARPVGNVAVIDADTNEVVTVVPVGHKPTGFAIPGAAD